MIIVMADSFVTTACAALAKVVSDLGFACFSIFCVFSTFSALMVQVHFVCAFFELFFGGEWRVFGKDFAAKVHDGPSQKTGMICLAS